MFIGIIILANALEYLNKINITGFADVEATAKYCRVVDSFLFS